MKKGKCLNGNNLVKGLMIHLAPIQKDGHQTAGAVGSFDLEDALVELLAAFTISLSSA